jgi:UDP-2,3-diacylglucosamine hydrolase
MAVYFISDLHLQDDTTSINEGFFLYINNLIKKDDVDQLYILGDFFEVWLGDDHSSRLTQNIQKILTTLASRGTELFFMHGNRDFLIGSQWLEENHCSLLQDPSIIKLGSQSVLLIHGDSLCTDDIEYQKMRSLFRSIPFQTSFLKQTIEQRKAFAQSIRNKSKSSQEDKHDDIMDVNQESVDAIMTEFNIDLCIHGHTHRPKIHLWKNSNNERTRMVLGDWSESEGWQLRWSKEDGFNLSSFKF